MSHPVRGAWIEILPASEPDKMLISRTPSGVRGLKSEEIQIGGVTKLPSHPVRGAWIEMGHNNNPLAG